MQIKQSIFLSKNSQNNESEWDMAIVDAELEVKDLKRKLARMRQAVQIFRANKRDGVPWPGKGKEDAATS